LKEVGLGKGIIPGNLRIRPMRKLFVLLLRQFS